jgi:hypothetical protein
MNGRTPMGRGCVHGHGFSSSTAAHFAVAKGAEGEVPDEACDVCGRWHLHVPEVRTGFSAEVKLLARIRSGHGDVSRAACESCGTRVGRYGGDIQHRLARGRGGSASEVVASLANAAVLCRQCHMKAEARNLAMRDDGAGWWIRTGKGPAFDPRFVPVRLHGETEPRWLSDSEPVYLESAPALEAV